MDTVWDGDSKEVEYQSIFKSKRHFSLMWEMSFLFFVINKSNTIKIAYTKILFLIEALNEAK